MVESATVYCNFEAQLTAAPSKMNRMPVVDRRVSKSPAQSASLNP